uniref:Ig-like domain-containing protein n=1 Tax=Panagrolaimus sp. JU765 TaxID=591449 RepID=A0AC34QBK9_9BILA
MCDITGSNVESIDWLYQGISLDYSVVEDYEIIKNGTLAITQRFSPKLFQCAANFVVSSLRQSRQLAPPRFGSQTWPPQNQNSDNAPRFTYTPRDRSYREGSS